jgi:hypothetical protein
MRDRCKTLRNAGALWGPRMLLLEKPTRLIMDLAQILAMPLIASAAP